MLLKGISSLLKEGGYVRNCPGHTKCEESLIQIPLPHKTLAKPKCYSFPPTILPTRRISSLRGLQAGMLEQAQKVGQTHSEGRRLPMRRLLTFASCGDYVFSRKEPLHGGGSAKSEFIHRGLAGKDFSGPNKMPCVS